MKRFFMKMYDGGVRHKAVVWVVLALCVLLSIGLASRLHYSEDIADFLPDNEWTAQGMAVYQQLGGQDKVAVLFRHADRHEGNGTADGCSADGGDPDLLLEAMEWFAETWERVDTSRATLVLRTDEGLFADTWAFIQNHYAYFLTTADYRRMDSLLADTGYVARRLAEARQMLLLPTGGLMADNLRHDPLQLFTPVLEPLQSLHVAQRYQIIDGCVFSKDATRGLIFITSPYGGSESEYNALLARQIDDVIRQTETQCPAVRVSAIGGPLIAAGNASRIKQDSIWSVTLAVVLVFIILLWSFRRLSDLFWMAASLIFGALFALGVLAIFKDSISMIVLGIGSVIIGIAVNYPLHFLDHLKHEPDKRMVLKEMLDPLLIGNITTVSAFLCLAFLPAEALRDLGLFGSLVLIGTILFVLVFLPILVKSRPAVHVPSPVSPAVAVSPRRSHWSRFGALSIVFLTGLFFYCGLGTAFNADLQNINYMTDSQRSDFHALYHEIQGEVSEKTFYAVVEESTLQDALQAHERWLEALDTVAWRSGISQIEGIGRFLPSEDCQAGRLAAWRTFWDTHADLPSVLTESAVRAGFAPQAFQPFVESVAATYAVRDAAYFEPIGRLLGETYMQSGDSTVRIVDVLMVDAEEADTLKPRLRALLRTMSDKGFLFDADDMNGRITRMLSDSFNFIGWVCGLVVFFFLWLTFGRIELSLLSFLPLAVGWIWILGIMQVFGIQFNIVNIILATLIFGQGDDYTIFITEGLMYEYAYGKKNLTAYKKSVAVSAILMLIGMGILVFTDHPAMKSLGKVAVIGMLTVVGMAYYLPPLVFRWITSKSGVLRDVPITLKRLVYSVFVFLFFLLSVWGFMLPFTFLYFHIGKTTEKKRLRFHRLLWRYADFVIRRVPGVKFRFENPAGETFGKPTVIIANHQSHLDLMCLMMLTPKLVILTNDWVWRNPFYGYIIRHAEFYPVSDGLETNIERLRSLMDRGYSVVVFPEGTRSDDGRILRFHQGAFHLAARLRADILPVYLHGLAQVLPKRDFMLREGAIYVEVGCREPFDSRLAMATSDGVSGSWRAVASSWRATYRARYAAISRQCETVAYYAAYVQSKYLYKGRSVERQAARAIARIRCQAERVEHMPSGTASAAVSAVRIWHSGQGELAWFWALVHPEMTVYAYEQDEEQHLLAVHTPGQPSNLHFVRWTAEEMGRPESSAILPASQADNESDAVGMKDIDAKKQFGL